jgi:hypothetical protein
MAFGELKVVQRFARGFACRPCHQSRADVEVDLPRMVVAIAQRG